MDTPSVVSEVSEAEEAVEEQSFSGFGEQAKKTKQYMRSVLNESTCPVFRDPFDDFKPLERLFGSMTVGMAFGESGFLNIAENIPRFYNAVALSECICLTISKNEYLRYLDKQEKKSENQKLIFIK